MRKTLLFRALALVVLALIAGSVYSLVTGDEIWDVMAIVVVVDLSVETVYRWRERRRDQASAV